MRHGRAKAARKTLQYFRRTVGLQAPYSILVDATFVAALFQQNILPVKERVDKILQTAQTQHVNRYYIPQEAVDELRTIQEGLQARNHEKTTAFAEALQWIRRECIILRKDEIEKSTKDAESDGNDDSSADWNKKSSTAAQSELLKHLKGSETAYVVASQDEDLLDSLRRMGSVPIVRLANNTVLILENPSKSSQNQAKGAEHQKWRHQLPEAERALVDLVKKESSGNVKMGLSSSTSPAQRQKPRVKKAKGPNPLSCKRKQSNNDSKKESSSKKRRTRAKKAV